MRKSEGGAEQKRQRHTKTNERLVETERAVRTEWVSGKETEREKRERQILKRRNRTTFWARERESEKAGPSEWMVKRQKDDEDNDDVIESFWLYTFSVFPSFVYYYLDRIQFFTEGLKNIPEYKKCNVWYNNIWTQSAFPRDKMKHLSYL